MSYFFSDIIKESDSTAILPETSSKHIAQVLRMKNGDVLKLTDGLGNIYKCTIIDDNRKAVIVSVNERQYVPEAEHKTIIAISPIKNTSRFEWFLEKAVEIGVSEIVPLLCERSEKQIIKPERYKNIIVSAMLQSQQARLPKLWEAVKFMDLLKMQNFENKLIAHCGIDFQKKSLSEFKSRSLASIICIGPEGDFTEKEIEMAMSANYVPVSLGSTRLRTETAGIYAAVLLKSSMEK